MSNLKLCLIGMSGSGKSHWSNKLKFEFGFEHFSCDEKIWDLISLQIEKSEGDSKNQTPELRLANWLKQPFNENFKLREAQYLDAEARVLLDGLEKLENATGNFVLDTSGSVIYLQRETLEKLKYFSNIIYLSRSSDERARMFLHFLADPKPIIWGSSFTKLDSENNLEALSRSYGVLLDHREHLYKELSEVELEEDFHRNKKLSCEKFLEKIKYEILLHKKQLS